MKNMIFTDKHIIRLLILIVSTLSNLPTASSQIRRIKVYDDYQRSQVPSIYVDFVEQSIARLADCSEPAASQIARRYMMELTINDNDMTNQAHNWALGLIDFLDRCESYSTTYDGDYLNQTWSDLNSKSYSLKVKIARETFEGTDKAEADSIVVKRLQNLPQMSYNAVIPEKTHLIKTSESDMLILPGNQYILSTTNGDTYYCKDEGKIVSVFNENYPVESLKNLMQSAVDNDYILDIKVSLYGGIVENIPVNLKDFTDYWKSNTDFEIYSDVDQTDTGYKIVHIAMNRLLRYAHVSIINFENSYFKNPTATLKCTTVLNVPQHNIRNLFPEK